METSVDVAIVGAGTAGLRAYRRASELGASAVLIEGGVGGTTCARVGCMPSKLLIAAAEAAHHVREAPGFGVHAGEPRVDGVEVMARVRSERDRFVGFVRQGVDQIPSGDKLTGWARFLEPGVLEVGERRVRARAAVLATGSSPTRLPVLDALGDRLVVNDGLFEWTDLPASVAVIGPGVIGLELGQALHRLGVRVRIFGHSARVGPSRDPAVQAACRDIFGRELDLVREAEIEEARRVEDAEVELRYRVAGELHTARFQYVLVATGRSPNLERLELEAAGVSRDARGLVEGYRPTTCQVGDLPVFLAGDATGDRPILHEASDEGRLAGENAARYPAVRTGRRASPFSVVFSDPQIVSVGDAWPTLQGAMEAGDVVVGEVDFGDQGRSRVMLQNRGRLRVYADRTTGRLRGASGVGPRLEHLGHLLAWSHQQGLTLAEMLALPFYHPVVEEGLRTALRDAERARSAS